MNKLLSYFFIFLVISINISFQEQQEDVSSQSKTVDCPVIGIDLGTTFSCVGIFKNGNVEIIPNELGNRITPSVVAFTDEERLFGEAAKNQAGINPSRTVYDVKRLIGRKFHDKTVQQDKKYFPFEIVDKDSKPYIKALVKNEEKVFAPEEISAMVLQKMKDIAETFIGNKVINAVVTVPAYFNDAQRSATKDAGTIAGLNVVRILNEPTSAALAYGMDKKGQEINVMVYDLGGGTFDVSIMTIENGVFQVIATNGDTHLGGEDFDQRIVDHFAKIIKNKYKIDISNDKKAIQKLKRECERAKRQLSSTHEAKMEVEGLSEGFDFADTLTRAKFEELNADYFKKTLGPVQIALDDSGFTKDQINEVILVGGSTRIPKIRQLVKDFFDGKELHTQINPDEAVCFGAAVQGAIICGDESNEEDFLIIDATPLSLGIETVGGVFAKVIQKGSYIPTRKTQTFTTHVDNQDTVTVTVFEGERPMVKDNHELGRFDISGLPRMPRGKPQIDVTFEIDENGILQVTAHEKSKGIKNSITVTNDKGRLSKEEIEEMLKEASEFAEDDKKIKEKTDSKNKLDNYIYGVRSQIEDKDQLKDKLDDEELNQIEEALAEAKEWFDQNPDATAEEYNEQYNELESVCKPILKKYAKEDENGEEIIKEDKKHEEAKTEEIDQHEDL